jgi:hypothetical protein
MGRLLKEIKIICQNGHEYGIFQLKDLNHQLEQKGMIFVDMI